MASIGNLGLNVEQFDRVLAFPWRLMTYDRQLNLLVAGLAAVATFIGSIFSGAVTTTVGALIAAGVFLAGLFFGRRIAETVLDLLH